MKRIMSSLLLQRQLFRDSFKLFSTSSSRAIRKIVVKEEGKTITIEGAKEESPRAKNMIDPKLFSASSSCEAYEKCHPLCQFDKIHEIKHTDLLILEQFVDSEGELMPRKLTKLCERQHYRLNKLVGMAQKAGLMESKDKFKAEKVTKPWAKYNSYWDEKTIDVQWHQYVKKRKIESFKK